MAKKKITTEDHIVCKTIKTKQIELMDDEGGIRGVIATSSDSLQPYISLFADNITGGGITLSIGKGGRASIGIANKKTVIAGLSAHPDGRRAVFVYDDDGREVFAAGIDLNGERFVEMRAFDGSKIWEKRVARNDPSPQDGRQP